MTFHQAKQTDVLLARKYHEAAQTPVCHVRRVKVVHEIELSSLKYLRHEARFE